MKTLAELLTAAIDGEFDVPEHTRAVVADIVGAVQEWLQGEAEAYGIEGDIAAASFLVHMVREAGRGLDA